MRIYYARIFFLYFLFSAAVQNANACGYDWVGECSSSVHLRINGTLDSFDIADCPSGIRFQGLHLGTLKTLSLANAKAINWESCINNVTAVNLKYRLYEQGGGVGSFQALLLAQDYFTIEGPYTTRYRSKASNIDLTAGLTVGKTYVLEVYFVADVDTIGDDFIPETTLTKNNGGQNYKLTFTYGGPGANPFVVVPTNVKTPNCHGESNGSIGVSVWGDHTNLFYNWSNVALNFYQQNGIPAGTYTVTVTGANHTESATVILGQPEVLSVQAGNIQPVACGGGLGSITAQASGGTVPYNYLWANGQTTTTATFPNSGNHKLTITDAHNCILVQTFNLPSSGTVQANRVREICVGQSIVVGGTVINAAGVYNLILPGNGGCDTLLSLTVNQIDPTLLLANIPFSIQLTCNAPGINLCAEVSPTAFYQWSKDGILATQTPCLLATAGGVYTLMVAQQGCTASKSIVSEEHFISLPAQFVGSDTLTCNGLGTTPTLFRAVTNAVAPTFWWTSNGQLLSMNDSCWFVISDGGFNIILPELVVMDVYGCTTQATSGLLITQDADVPVFFISTTDASGPNVPDGSASALGSGGESFDFIWSNGSTGQNIQNLLPGTYCVTVTGENGCAISDCETVGYLVGVYEGHTSPLRLSPNPIAPGEWLSIDLPHHFEEGILQFQLTDSQGKEIWSDDQGNNQESLRFKLPETLETGVYFLRILSENGQLTGKLLLKK